MEERLQQTARDFPTYAVLRIVLAQLHTELGREDAAREIVETLAVDDFAGVPRDDEWIFCLSLLADVTESLGDVPRADALYRLLSPYAGRNALSNPDNCIGSVARSLGILAAMTRRGPEAIRHFEDALAMNARTNARPWLARTQYDYARFLLTRDAPDDRERASHLLARAHGTCQELGMTAVAARVSALWSQKKSPADRSHDAQKPSSRRVPARPDPRERLSARRESTGRSPSRGRSSASRMPRGSAT